MEPKSHRFHYNVFMFYIDLDELPLLNKKLRMLSHNRFNFFSFKDSEHLQLPANLPDKSKPLKAHIVNYLAQNGFAYKGQKIMLLTNLNVLGYNFNPVSFYFILGESGEAECAIAEVSNTFGEMKPYFLEPETLKDGSFRKRVPKLFYVSPFIAHDASFDFNFRTPGQKLNIRIDDYKDDRRIFISTLSGTKKPLNNRNLFWYSLRFPLITLQVIGLIHWNALLLWLKKIHYHKKAAYPELQQDVYKKYKIP